MIERTAICAHCGDEYEQNPRQRRACCRKPECFRAAENQRIRAIHASRPKPPRKAPKPRPTEPVECSNCSATYQRMVGAKVGELGLFCPSEQCQRAMNNLRMKVYAAKKRAEGINIYAPYSAASKARQRARIAAGEQQSWRERNPQKAREHDELRRARKFAAQVGEQFTHAEIFVRDGWICGLCGEPVDAALAYPDPMSKSLDHVVPLSRGGKHSRRNVQLAHLDCNVRKSAKVSA